MLNGLRSLIYPSKDLAADKAFWTKALGIQPYFDQPFYVGFNVGGHELGLDPNGHAEGNGTPISYWGVDDIEAAVADLQAKEVAQRGSINDVGEGIRMAIFLDANGTPFGLIENPQAGN